MQSAPRGGILQLSSLWVEAGWLMIQEMEFEFFRQHVDLQRDLGHRKNKFPQRSQQVLLYMNAKSWMVNLFCQASPGNGLEDFYCWANGGQFWLLWKRQTIHKNPPFSHLTTIRNSQMLILQTAGQTCTSAKWHHFVSIIVEDRMITKGRNLLQYSI